MDKERCKDCANHIVYPSASCKREINEQPCVFDKKFIAPEKVAKEKLVQAKGAD